MPRGEASKLNQGKNGHNPEIQKNQEWCHQAHVDGRGERLPRPCGKW
ncbi:hypothetical protein CyaNS01_00969 [Cyanobium sp. NS01]|nr:hypothetical protein CyaNS01_00969 [Cyanobium sp. NS01]